MKAIRSAIVVIESKIACNHDLVWKSLMNIYQYIADAMTWKCYAKHNCKLNVHQYTCYWLSNQSLISINLTLILILLYLKIIVTKFDWLKQVCIWQKYHECIMYIQSKTLAVKLYVYLTFLLDVFCSKCDSDIEPFSQGHSLVQQVKYNIRKSLM